MSGENLPPELYRANIAAEALRNKSSGDPGTASPDNSKKIEELSKQLSQLSLLTESMWLLLQKTSGLKPGKLQLALTRFKKIERNVAKLA